MSDSWGLQVSWWEGKEEDGCCPCMDGSVQSAFLGFPSSCSILGHHAGPRPPPAGVPPRYRKAVFVEYPDGSFTQPKLKPAWMGKKHLQCGELQQSLTATRPILGWLLAAPQPGAGEQLGGSRYGRAPGGAEALLELMQLILPCCTRDNHQLGLWKARTLRGFWQGVSCLTPAA